jgi:hypothetical protein
LIPRNLQRFAHLRDPTTPNGFVKNFVHDAFLCWGWF